MQGKDILRNNVTKKLARNEVVASMTVRLVGGIEIAQIAKTAGFDMLYVDMEHSSLSFCTSGQRRLSQKRTGYLRPSVLSAMRQRILVDNSARLSGF